MGRAIAAGLSRQGCERVTVATRDPDAFAAAGGTRHACAVRPDAILALVSDADVVFTASGTGKQLITTQTVVRAMADRTTRTLLLLDLAMPSEVDLGVAHVPGVRLVTLDTLERSIERVAQSRSEAITNVERIVEETLNRLFAWSPRVHQAA